MVANQNVFAGTTQLTN